METELISEFHTIKELPASLEIPKEMKQFDPDRKIRVFGLKDKESEELICVAVFLSQGLDKDQIQLLHLYTEPAYRSQKFMEHLLKEVCIVLKTEGVERIYTKLIGYGIDRLYIFSRLAERTGFEPLIVEGFLLDYDIKKLDISDIKNIRKLPSECKIKSFTALTRSEKKELKDSELVQYNGIKLKQRPDSKSKLLFLNNAEKGKTEPVIYLDVMNGPNDVPVFGVFETGNGRDFTDIIVPLILYTLQECVRENKSISEFQIIVVGNKKNADIQNTLGRAQKQLRLQEYIMKL